MANPNQTTIAVSVNDLGALASIISEIDMAQAGLSNISVKDLAKQAHDSLIKMLGKHELAIYAEADPA